MLMGFLLALCPPLCVPSDITVIETDLLCAQLKVDKVSDTSSPYQLGQKLNFLSSRLWFLIACSMQKRRGKSWSIYKVRVSFNVILYRVRSMAQLYTIIVGIKLFMKVISALMEFLQNILQCDRWKGGGKAGPSTKCV